MMDANSDAAATPVLVIGGSGKTGRRVVERLAQKGVPVRGTSRSATPPFDWDDPQTWPTAIGDARAVYVTYYPDIALPGGVKAIKAFTATALAHGLRRLVLLTGRGEEEAQRAEQVLMRSGADWTIVRASWFAQNFSESFFLDDLLAGTLAFPRDGVPEPFIDADDIADVVVAALTDDRHVGQLYEVTGPRLLTFRDAVGEIAEAAGRPIRFVPVEVDDYVAALRTHGVPLAFATLLEVLTREVLDGRNAQVSDGVERALGRQPRDFRDFAQATAATGLWGAPPGG